MILVSPTDEAIVQADGVMLMDSSRGYYEPVGDVTTNRDDRGSPTRSVDHLTIIVNSGDLAELDQWRKRIKLLRRPVIAR